MMILIPATTAGHQWLIDDDEMIFHDDDNDGLLTMGSHDYLSCWLSGIHGLFIDKFIVSRAFFTSTIIKFNIYLVLIKFVAAIFSLTCLIKFSIFLVVVILLLFSSVLNYYYYYYFLIKLFKLKIKCFLIFPNIIQILIFMY